MACVTRRRRRIAGFPHTRPGTEGRSAIADDDAQAAARSDAPAAPELPPPPLAPPQPPPPPGPHRRAATPAGSAPPPWPPGPRLGVGSVIGRTFDTFGREWSLFLVLAAPAALVGVLQLLTSRRSARSTRTACSSPAAADEPLLPGVGVVVATAVGLTGLACAVAADRLWRGEPAGIGDSAATAVRSIPRAIPSGCWCSAPGRVHAGRERFMPTTPSAAGSPGAAGERRRGSSCSPCPWSSSGRSSSCSSRSGCR